MFFPQVRLRYIQLSISINYPNNLSTTALGLIIKFNPKAVIYYQKVISYKIKRYRDGKKILLAGETVRK